MIQYTSINEAWGISNNYEKEIFKNLKIEKNKKDTKQIETLDNQPPNEITSSPCEMFNHIFTCEECMGKLREHLNINTIDNNNLNRTEGNTFIKTIEGFSNRISENKDLTTFIIIVAIVIILILLVQSYRKPVELRGLQKSFYVFPEDLDKIKALLESQK
jgi:hypothetical protein